MKRRAKNILILFSGGIDSTACICYYKKLHYQVEGLFVDYGQKSLEYELDAIEHISNYYNIKTRTIKIETSSIIKKNGEIQGRNNLLLSIALMNFPFSMGLISLGIHSGTNFTDCSKEFINTTQIIFDLYTSGNILIDCPFIDMNKRSIFEFCLRNNVPLELTYSCEIGSAKQPCGNCSSCKDLITLYENGNENA